MEKLTGLWHLFVTVFLAGMAPFIVMPVITDVTMMALCPGVDECSLAIYLTGFQQAAIGVGSVVMTPLIGNLSDQYGRKALLTLPMTLGIIPHAILACSRAKEFVYAYYVIGILTTMVCGGSVGCITLAYVADNVTERQRAPAFGILAGVGSASFVCGTLTSRFLPTEYAFQVATLLSMAAVVYMRIFLNESLPEGDASTRPLLKTGKLIAEDTGQSSRTVKVTKKIPSVRDLIDLLKTSVTFSQIVVVSFFNSLAEGAMQAAVMYYFKARFHFEKNQFADLMLLGGSAGTISQLFFMSLLLPAIGEEKLLSVSLLVGCTNMFLYSTAWSAWIPYAMTATGLITVFARPCISSIVSKQVGPSEQGKAQGCISGVSSLANIVAPLIFSPLTALFLSESPPFNFPGFSISCIGFALMIAFIQSIMIKAAPSIAGQRSSSNICTEA